MNMDLEYSWMRAMIEGHNVAQVERDLIEARDIIARDYPGAAFAAESNVGRVAEKPSSL